jgi:hypothetical protein
VDEFKTALVDVLAIALLAACMQPGCGSSNGSPSHDASAGGSDASGSGATPDGGTGASSSSGGASGDSSGGDASSGDSSGDSGGGKSDGGDSDIQKPGPSAQLFNNPYYQCLRNFYVSTAGNDSKDGTSPGTAWATIANADTSDRKGGDCINVAPGTYAHFNNNMTHGGTTASSTGYVAYRCTTPAFISGTGCVVTDTGDAVRAGMYTSSSAYPSYLIFDGFNFVTMDQTVQDDVAIACAGPGSFGTMQTASLGCHHWWAINNVITGHGQGGVGINDTEFSYTVHNTVTQNARMGCAGFYGSGISYVVAKPVTGYTKTPDDTNANNNASLNLMGIQGPDFPFNDVVAWNDVGNNYQGCDTIGSTDGNGIIIDTFNITKCNANMVDYPNSTLVAFNVSYNNGGGGVHVFASAHVTVANNSVYYNGTDPTQQAWDRPGIDVNCGSGTAGFGAGTNLYINNIAYAIPSGQPCPGANDTYLGSQIPFSIGGDGTHLDAVFNSPGGNISYSIGTPCHATDSSGNATAAPNPAWSCTTNRCNADPQWVDVGDTSQGSDEAPPNGVNFALKAGSPAIGAGATEGYLPPSSVDVGACSSALTTCP